MSGLSLLSSLPLVWSKPTMVTPRHVRTVTGGSLTEDQDKTQGRRGRNLQKTSHVNFCIRSNTAFSPL